MDLAHGKTYTEICTACVYKAKRYSRMLFNHNRVAILESSSETQEMEQPVRMEGEQEMVMKKAVYFME